MDKRKRVLVIDNDKAVNNSIAEFLKDFEYDVLKAQDGIEGLDIFSKNKIDLVLVDLKMPGMDGLEVLHKIKEISDGIPVIVISGIGIIDEAVQALRYGAWDYLCKPIKNMHLLIHVIERALERENFIKQNRDYQSNLKKLLYKKTRVLEKERLVRKKNQKERENLITILDSTSDIVFIEDVDGTLIYMNKKGRKILGFSSQDISKYKSSKIYTKEALKVVEEKAIPEAIEKGIWEGGNVIYSRSGEKLVVSQMIMSHKSSNGEIESLSTIIHFNEIKN